MQEVVRKAKKIQRQRIATMDLKGLSMETKENIKKSFLESKPIAKSPNAREERLP